MEKKCEDDPIYNVLFHPEIGTTTRDLIHAGIIHVNKRYGQDFRNTEKIQDMFKALEDPNYKDYNLHKFVIMFFIYWEKKIENTVLNLYGDKGLFEENGKDHFKQLLIKLHEFVEKTIQFQAYDHANIMEIIENFTQATKESYWLGNTYHEI